MPDIMLFISQFFYRIRYWLLWGTLFVTGLVIYFTQFLPYSYTVKSSLYAGITNSTSLDGASINFSVVTATFDNLISIAKSRGTLEKVSLRLLANSLTYPIQTLSPITANDSQRSFGIGGQKRCRKNIS